VARVVSDFGGRITGSERALKVIDRRTKVRPVGEGIDLLGTGIEVFGSNDLFELGLPGALPESELELPTRSSEAIGNVELVISSENDRVRRPVEQVGQVVDSSARRKVVDLVDKHELIPIRRDGPALLNEIGNSLARSCPGGVDIMQVPVLRVGNDERRRALSDTRRAV